MLISGSLTWINEEGSFAAGDCCEISLREASISSKLAAMSDANKALAREWFEQVWNRKSEAAIDRLFHPQGKAHGFPDPNGVLVGPEAFKIVHRNFCGACPDLHVEVEDVLADGDRVAIRWKATMTHTGDHFGFPATGKKDALSGSSFIITDGHQILEGWNHMDLQALFLRLQSQ
ncbi:MAG TPA: ester cyclase [Terracidiphilus sp.]|nr:ester cyclase [Terracidiphilus sp.]